MSWGFERDSRSVRGCGGRGVDVALRSVNPKEELQLVQPNSSSLVCCNDEKTKRPISHPAEKERARKHPIAHWRAPTKHTSNRNHSIQSYSKQHCNRTTSSTILGTPPYHIAYRFRWKIRSSNACGRTIILVLILWWTQLGQGGDRTDAAPSRVPPPAASSSSHPGPPASPAIDLDIFCLLHPDDSPSQHIFLVTVRSDRTVGDLKDAIKQKKTNDLKDIDANKLILFKVLMPAAVFTARSS